MSVLVIMGLLGTVGLQNYKPVIANAQKTADIYEGRIIKEAIDLFYVIEGRYPLSIAELQQKNLLGNVVSAQKVGQEPIVVNDGKLGSPVFAIELAIGRVRVFDVASGQVGTVVWDSE
jgi:type II secretory pathway pseudopilin PulG